MTLIYYGLFLVLGSVISFEDWTHKKIRNRLIIFGLLACAAGLCWLLANSILGYRQLSFRGVGEYYLPWRYYSKIMLHLLLSLAAAFTLWRMSVWPAGDAKFFTICAFFVALIDPNLPGFPSLLFLLLLINIFVPAGLIFAVETAALGALRLRNLRGVDGRVWLKAQADTAAKRLKDAWPFRRDYLILAVNVFAMFYVLQAGRERFGRVISGPWGSLAIFALMGISWRVLVTLLRRRAVGLIVLVGVSAWTLEGFLRQHWSVSERLGAAIAMTFNFGIFLSVGRILMYRFIERESLRELRADQLRPGVVLSDKTWELLRSQKGLADKMERRSVDGLRECDVVALKAWLASSGAAGYTVYHTIPFAAWIFLGALLTLSVRGNIVAVLKAAFTRGLS